MLANIVFYKQGLVNIESKPHLRKNKLILIEIDILKLKSN